MNTSDQTILKDPSVMHSQYVLTCSVQVESGWEHAAMHAQSFVSADLVLR